jgi:hypothetical protein
MSGSTRESDRHVKRATIELLGSGDLSVPQNSTLSLKSPLRGACLRLLVELFQLWGRRLWRVHSPE